MDTIVIRDTVLTRLKLLEIFLPIVVGSIILSIMKPEEYTSPAAIPLFAALSLVFIDGLLGFSAVRKGIEINPHSRQICFPHWYR